MFTPIIFLLVFVWIAIRFKKISGSTARDNNRRRSPSQKPVSFDEPRPLNNCDNTGYPEDMSSNRRNKKGLSLSESALRDNPDNWLTYQLREEQKTKAMTDEMFNLRRDHEDSCDARKLKEQHLREHGKR